MTLKIKIMDELKKDDESLYLKLKSEVIESIDKRVSNHLDKDREFIKGIISTVSKVIIGVLGFISIVFAILGITTYSDIKNAINKYAETIIDNELSKTDILKKYESKVKILYTNALAESYLLKLEKQENNSPFWFKVEFEHLEHFIDIIDSQELDFETFDGVTSLLAKTRIEPNEKERLVNKLKKILSKDFSFDTYNNEKLSKILKILHEIDTEEFKENARNIITDSKENLELRISAISYIQTANYQSLPLLEELYSAKEESLRKASINAIAFCDCSNEKVQEYKEEKLKGEITIDEAGDLLEMISKSFEGVYYRNGRQHVMLTSSGISMKGLDTCKKLSKKLVKDLIDKGFAFTYSQSPIIEKSPIFKIYLQNQWTRSTPIDEDIFLKYHIESELLLEVADSLEVFAKYLYGLNGIPLPIWGEEEARIIGKVKNGASIGFIDGEILSSSISGNIIITLNKKGNVIGTWWDYTDRLVSKEIIDLSGFKNFQYATRRNSHLTELWWK